MTPLYPNRSGNKDLPSGSAKKYSQQAKSEDISSPRLAVDHGRAGPNGRVASAPFRGLGATIVATWRRSGLATSLRPRNPAVFTFQSNLRPLIDRQGRLCLAVLPQGQSK